MTSKAAITIHKPREDVQRQWNSSEYGPRYAEAAEAVVFKDAPGDRGAEIHVDLGQSGPAGKVSEAVRSLFGSAPLPKVKDDLRHFKQQLETGEIPRSDASPEGERAERKLKQRPAQPLERSELEEVGVR
jgi:uncharacterized membrane protein